MFGILKFFERKETIELVIPAEKLEQIQRAAVASGCSVEKFIVNAAKARARELAEEYVDKTAFLYDEYGLPK